jgi:dolichyl-diphosphooligosaccharide--protein glycosyltransferase
LFLILAVKRAKEKGISFGSIRNKEWGNIRKPLIYALLTGIALGMYVLSWVGGLLLIFILLSYVVIQYIIDHLRGKSTDYLCIIGVPIFLIALIMVVPFLNRLAYGDLSLLSLIIGVLIFPVLSGVSRFMKAKSMKRVYYPLTLVGLGIISLVALYIISPSLFDSMKWKFNIFTPSTGSLTISEARPLFSAYGAFSLAPAWDRFTTGIVIAPVSLILITYAAIKKVSAEKILFLVWSVIMLAAVLGQVRFTYYFAVNAGLLGGYLCWRIPGWISAALKGLGFRETPEAKAARAEAWGKKKKEKLLKGKKRRAKERGWLPTGVITRYLRPKYVSGALAVIVIFFLAFYPNIGPALSKANIALGPNEDWHESLLWMRDNTPDPFQDPDFYYELYEKPLAEGDYDYPLSAYGVMNWWDYGHWITEIAHRIPNSNPHQRGAGSAARFFTAQSESVANEMLDKLGSRYVIIDVEMVTPYEIADSVITTGKFRAMATWAGEDISQFSEVYYWETGGKLEPVVLYYPEYYQSMGSRLYNFGGQQVIPEDSTKVVAWVERDGRKEITNFKEFPTYEDAQEYLEGQASPSYRVVGNDPFDSPVPLEKLEHYQLVHHSDSWEAKRGGEILAYYVEIFEYMP